MTLFKGDPRVRTTRSARSTHPTTPTPTPGSRLILSPFLDPVSGCRVFEAAVLVPAVTTRTSTDSVGTGMDDASPIS